MILVFFYKGIILSLANPLAVIFWLVWGTYFSQQGWLILDNFHISIFMLGVAVGTISTLLTYSLLSKIILKSIGSFSRWMNQIIGVILLFLWFFSTHSTAPNNFNILWAFAPNLVIAFLILKKKQPKWLHLYFKFLLILLICIPILWLAKIQTYPIVIIPLLAYKFRLSTAIHFHHNLGCYKILLQGLYLLQYFFFLRGLTIRTKLYLK